MSPSSGDDAQEVTADLILHAYACGIFPMGEDGDDPDIYWVEPEMRGVFPLDGFHVPSRLARFIRADTFAVRVDHDFDAVIDACAAPAEGRRKTWINSTIRQLYGELFARGFCHTVECYREGALVGGLYGISLGGAFFGESMFHRETDASKVALAHLVARLIRGGFTLLDTQFVTPHLATLGAVEWPRDVYRERLDAALEQDGILDPAMSLSGDEVLATIRAAKSPKD